MTAKEWFNSIDVDTMLAFVAGRDAPAGAVLPLVPMSERKLRLFLVGCCRRHWHLFEDLECCQAIEIAERFADGEASEEEREFREQKALDTRTQVMEETLISKQRSQSKWMLWFAADIAFGTCVSPEWLTRRANYYGRSPTFVPLDPRHRHMRIGWVPRRFIDWHKKKRFPESPSSESESQRIQDMELYAQAHLLRCIVGNPFRLPNIDPSWFNPTVISIAERIYSERDFALLPILADALEEAGCNNQEMLQHCRESSDHARGCWVVDWVLGKR